MYDTTNDAEPVPNELWLSADAQHFYYNTHLVKYNAENIGKVTDQHSGSFDPAVFLRCIAVHRTSAIGLLYLRQYFTY